MAENIIHRVEAPDGTILRVEGPADASPEQIVEFANRIYRQQSAGAKADDRADQRVQILQDEYRRTNEKMLAAEQVAISTPTKENMAAYDRLVGDMESLRRELTKLGGEESIPDLMPPVEEMPAAVDQPASEQDFQAQKARIAVDVLGAGAGAALSKGLDIGKAGADTMGAIRQLPELLKGQGAGPVGGPATSSGAKWLQNWGGITKEGFQGGVPEASAQYNKMKPQGQVMGALAKKGLMTPQPVQPGVFTGGQLSIGGQKPAMPAPPAPGPLSQAGGMAKKAVGAVAGSPVLSGALGGLSMAESGQEFFNRYKQNDIPGMMISGAGAVGGGMQMLPAPQAKALGAGLSAASPLTMYLYDKLRGRGKFEGPLTPQEEAVANKPAFVFPRP